MPEMIRDSVLKGAGEEASRTFIRNWFALRRGRQVPDRRDIDPGALAPLLPRLWMWEMAAEQGDFACRLAGEEICLVFGRNPRGTLLRDWVPEGVAGVARPRYRRVLDEPAICIAAGHSYVAGNKRAWCERVIAPMTNGAERPSVVFGISTWKLPEFATGPVEREETTAAFYPLQAQAGRMGASRPS